MRLFEETFRFSTLLLPAMCCLIVLVTPIDLFYWSKTARIKAVISCAHVSVSRCWHRVYSKIWRHLLNKFFGWFSFKFNFLSVLNFNFSFVILWHHIWGYWLILRIKRCIIIFLVILIILPSLLRCDFVISFTLMNIHDNTMLWIALLGSQLIGRSFYRCRLFTPLNLKVHLFDSPASILLWRFCPHISSSSAH